MTVHYTNEHEWIRMEGDVGTIGITNYAQEQLGDVVFVDVPQVGRKVTKGESIAVVESVKAASDIFAPVSGEIVEANSVASELSPVGAEVDDDGIERGIGRVHAVEMGTNDLLRSYVAGLDRVGRLYGGPLPDGSIRHVGSS